MMKSIIRMISSFFLLSLFIILGTQARTLSAILGENGGFKLASINYNKEKEWMSMVAEQIVSSSSFISNYRRLGMNNYKKGPPSPPPPPSASPTIGHTILTTPLKPKMSEYGTIAKSPPPPPYASPTKGHVSSSLLKPWMREGDLGKTAQSPPPTPHIAPAKDDTYLGSSTTTNKYRRSIKSPPPRDIWIASTLIADC